LIQTGFEEHCTGQKYIDSRLSEIDLFVPWTKLKQLYFLKIDLGFSFKNTERFLTCTIVRNTKNWESFCEITVKITLANWGFLDQKRLGLFLEESLLTNSLCHWSFSRLCKGLFCCINQGVFLNPSWSFLSQDMHWFFVNL